MKVLSLVIPMYNTELYVERCLDSVLYDDSIVKLLDVIIVDDGSSDKSLEVVKRYEDQYPGSITVIKKENGGHGSAVNRGIAAAKGKYVRILDSDDWVNIDDFGEYVNRLSKEEADVVVTNVRKQLLYDNGTDDFVFCSKKSSVKKIETVADKVMEDMFFFEFSMHSMTVKTEVLRSVWGEGLLEKTFYVDQQFVAKVFMCAKNYVVYDLLVYMYFIGRPEQSMGAGFFVHIQDHERVLKWLLKTTNDSELPDYYKTIVSRQVELMLMTHYKAYAEQPKLSKAKIEEIKRFDSFLRKNYQKYYAASKVSGLARQILSPVRRSKPVKATQCFRKARR